MFASALGLPPQMEDFFSPYWSPAGWTAGAQAGGQGALAPPTTGSGGAGAASTGGTGGSAPVYTRTIPVDFIERDTEYVLRADIPGVHKSEIRVTVDGNIVRFGHQPHPDREAQDEKEEGIFHRAERVSSFRGRALRMPDNADCERVAAKYEDGVLELTIAKKAAQQAKAEGRTITVE